MDGEDPLEGRLAATLAVAAGQQRGEAMRKVHMDTAQLHAAWEAGEPYYPALLGFHQVLRLTKMAEFLQDPYIKNRKAPDYWKGSEEERKAK